MARQHPFPSSRAAAWCLAACLAGTGGDVLALGTQLVESGFSAPLFLTAPNGDPRLFVVERQGTVKVFAGGTWSTFLDISAQVESQTGERGLLGLAFDPNYAVRGAPGEGTFYVNYIDRTTLHTQIARFSVSSNPNVANPTGTPIMTIEQPNRSNHKAGWIGFRPNERDNLYIATGDGGGANDPDNNGQNTNSLLGKMLRVDIRNDAFPADSARNYAIPTGNPFSAGGGAPEVWAYGLRNPFRNSFDGETGDLYIGDVGQGNREEIDFESASSPGGVNYGWRLREGSIENPAPGVGGPAPGAQDPAYDYPTPDPGSVTGGYVYRGSFLQEILGEYFFGDSSSGQVWSLRIDPDTGELIPGSVIERTLELDPLNAIGSVTSFGEDGLGNLYIVDLRGNVFAIVPEPSTFAILALALYPLFRLAVRGRQYVGAQAAS